MPAPIMLVALAALCTALTLKLHALQTIDKEDCLLCVCMVWMTLTMAKSTRRWSTGKLWAADLYKWDEPSVCQLQMLVPLLLVHLDNRVYWTPR